MKRVSVVSLSAASAAIVAVWLLGREGEESAAPSESAPATPTAGAAMLARQPVAFVPNLGQWEHPARFVARMGGTSVFLEERGFMLAAVERPARSATRDEPWHRQPPRSETLRGAAVRLVFLDSATPELVPEQRLAGTHTYLLGNDRDRWRTVPLHGAVRYREPWPGVDVLCYAKDGHLEYDVVLAPGADLARVEFSVEGAESVGLDQEGALVIETSVGLLRQPSPFTYVVDDRGQRTALVARYEMRGANSFGFSVHQWGGERELVLDPGLLWSTFLGGSDSESAVAVSVDAAGVVTVLGATFSSDYPATPGAWSTTNRGQGDVFVTRLDPSLPAAQQMLYSTFLGGQDQERPWDMSVDGSGVVTMTGVTWSIDYPVLGNGWSQTYSGDDAFVSRLDPSLPASQQLLYSTFLGGNGSDRAYAISIDPAGVLTVAGSTDSSDFPTTPRAWFPVSLGLWDVFVTQLDPSRPPAQQLLYSTYLGGTQIESALDVEVDPAGVVLVAGSTDSFDFPVTGNAWDVTYNQGGDVFVTRLDPSLPPSQQLVYSTYLGGSGNDSLFDVSVDVAGVVTMTGYSSSPRFPVTPNGWDPLVTGPSDAFVSRLDPSLPAAQQLIYSTLLGGSDLDYGWAMSVDTAGVVTIVGSTSSPNYPTTPGAWDMTFNGGFADVFVARLDPSRPRLQQLIYSTYLGGQDWDHSTALSVGPMGIATVTGFTLSPGFPATGGAWNTVPNGMQDAFVARLDMLPAGVTLFGGSSPGCDGPLAIGVTSMPGVGNQDFSITCTNAPPTGQGWLLGAAAGLSTPLPVLGALLWVDPNSAFRVTGSVQSNGVGAAEFALPIPAVPSLAGFTLYTQFAWIGPNAPLPCPFTGVSASAALEIVVQP